MNVVLYLRYSSDKQNEQYIEGQQRICTEYCNRNDMNIVGIYVDRALSASKNTEKRTEFLRMIKDSDKQNFEAVLVYKLDRFARNRYDSAIYKNKLIKNGVRVISATEAISESPEGVILESLLEGMAEYYSRELSQKVSRGMKETALKCNSCGGTIPLGYKVVNKKLVIDPDTAPVVIEAFNRYVEGEKIADICKSFNERGLRTSRGSEFNKHSFANMFKNKKYIGIYKYNDIEIPDGIPAIISKDVFDAAQERIKQNALAPGRAKAKIAYLLSGKLFCGHCNHQAVGEYGTSKNGEKYYYYNCSKKKKQHNCDKKAIPKEWIERETVKEAAELLTPENIEIIADMAIAANDEEIANNTVIPALKKQLEENQKGTNNLLKLVERGSTSESLFKRLDELELQKKELEKALETEYKDIIILEKEHIIWWLSKFANGDVDDPTYRRIVVEMLVNSVTVWDEPDGYKIMYTFNLTSKSTKTIKWSDFGKKGPPKPQAYACGFLTERSLYRSSKDENLFFKNT